MWRDGQYEYIPGRFAICIKKDCVLESYRLYYPACRGVAQPGRVLAWGARGRRFDSCHPDQRVQTARQGRFLFFNTCVEFELIIFEKCYFFADFRTFYAIISTYNNKKDYRMTMIAHGILALNKYLKDKEVTELENKSTTELSEKERQALADKLEKAWKSQNEANRKMHKLERAERKIDIFAGVLPLRKSGGPLALARTVTGVVVAIPVVVGALAYTGVEEAAKKIKEVKTKAALKAQENAEKAAESAEMTEIDLLKRVISNADIVRTRKVDIPTDKNAIVAGLIDEHGQIAEFASEHGRMVFFFDNNPEAKIVNAFFVNPETGNFEEIATVKSVRGRDQIVTLINNQLAIDRQKKKEHEEAQMRNAQIMAAIKQK